MTPKHTAGRSFPERLGTAWLASQLWTGPSPGASSLFGSPGWRGGQHKSSVWPGVGVGMRTPGARRQARFACGDSLGRALGGLCGGRGQEGAAVAWGAMGRRLCREPQCWPRDGRGGGRREAGRVSHGLGTSAARKGFWGHR